MKGQQRPRRIAARGDGAGVRSVGVAAAVLSALAAGGGLMPLKQLAAATGMSRAKVHRYLASLRCAGLVMQETEGGAYGIGSTAVAIGLAGLRLLNPVRQINDALPRLRAAVNETVTAAVWGDGGPTIIAIEESDRLVTMNLRVGSVLPVMTTAIGQLFAAYLPADVTARIIAAERRATAASLPATAERESRLARIRDRRLSWRHGALLPGIDAIAAPVFDHRGAIVAAICVVSRAEEGRAEPAAHLVDALAAAAAELSRRLGFIETAAAPPR
jgi:DNA-binding IclR family transcriptional regulator